MWLLKRWVFMDISREETLNKFEIELQKILAACQEQLDLFEKTEQQNVDQIKPDVRAVQQAAKEQIDKQIKDLADWLQGEYRENRINEEDLFARLEGLLALEPIYQFYRLASRQTFGIVEQAEQLPMDFVDNSGLETVSE
jgi:hypothetical protein